MELRIIQLGIIHLDDCIELDKKSLNVLWTTSQWERELNDPKKICIGAFENNSTKLIGLCSSWLILNQLYLTALAVHPKRQRQGIGKLILKDLINRVKAHGINQLILEVKDTNEPAKAFYKFMGFKLKGQRSNFYKDGNKALIYTKELEEKS